MTATATTWAEVLHATEQRLARAGVPEPAVDAAWLVSAVSGWSRTLLHLHRAERPARAVLDRLAPLVDRRARREPLAYVLGSQEFMGLSFAVDARVLVPRWDSEVLVERCVALVADQPAPLLADLGTGSGALAIALAHALPRARVWASDQCADALALARANAERLGVSARVTFLRGDLGGPLLAAGLAERCAAVVANLPYIPRAVLADLEPEVRDHEPRAALDGGPDGLDVVRAAAPNLAALLAPGGWTLVEHGDDQGPAVRALLAATPGLAVAEQVLDYGGRERAVLARRIA